MSKLYMKEYQEQDFEELEANTYNEYAQQQNIEELSECKSEKIFLNKVSNNYIKKSSSSIIEKISQYLLNYVNTKNTHQIIYNNSIQENAEKLNMLWKCFGALLLISISSTFVTKNIEVRNNIKSNNYVIAHQPETALQNIILDSLNFNYISDIGNLKKTLEKDLSDGIYSINIIERKNSYDNNKLQLIPKDSGAKISIEYRTMRYIDDNVIFTISGLNSSEKGKMEKSILINKLIEKNYPGYSININMPNEDEMIVLFMKKMVIPNVIQSAGVAPNMKSGIIVPDLPPSIVPEKK